MNTTFRVVFFGLISGPIWSVIPGVSSSLFQSGKDAIEVVAAGLLTGVIISLVLELPLKRFGKAVATILGLLSLPLGALAFGFVFSIPHHDRTFNDGQHGFCNAIQLATEYAILSVISVFAVFLLPLAILTTFVLRHVIHLRNQNAN
jgi:uncharacterized membrane protein